MWGNTQGWIISFLLLMLLLFGVHKLNEIALISPPTRFGLDEANLATVAFTIAPQTLVTMNEPLDAGPLYRAAIDDYFSNRDAYEHFNQSKLIADANKLSGLQNLLEATRAKAARVFSDKPEQVVTYGDGLELEALTALGHLAALAGVETQGTDSNEAQRFFESEFALGAKLSDERLTTGEFVAGMELLAESSAGLTRLLAKSDQPIRANPFRAFDAQRLSLYNQRILPMLKVLQGIDANVVADHAGDLFYFARNAKERMYRVEAILAIGRLKFFTGRDGRIGDQSGAMRELKRLADNSDPIISLAARRARDMTIEQYRVMR